MKSIKDLCLNILIASAPSIINSLQKSTGRFIFNEDDNGWGITNQDLIYPLAVLYTSMDPRNIYYNRRDVLEAVLLGGDCIRNFQYEDGRVEFLKADGSKWGPVYMPWTMYYWLEAYNLVRAYMGEEREVEWRKGLTLAMDGIKGELSRAQVHNITAWNGMSIYRAGQIFMREDYLKTGWETIRRVVAEQTPHGFWPEHGGPTTCYNLIYVHAIGLYYKFSRDSNVLEALKKSLNFHEIFTYPDGIPVETIDGRVKYNQKVSPMAIHAFTLFPKGRRYARFILEKLLEKLCMKQEDSLKSFPDLLNIPPIATAYVHAIPGEEEEILQDSANYTVNLDGKALVRRMRKWFYCLSAFTAKPTPNRWGMDRQNYFSLWHEYAGLIIGGGNSKNQPELSNFIVSNGKRMMYIAENAEVKEYKDSDILLLNYGGNLCTIKPKIVSDEEFIIKYGGKTVSNNVSVRYNLTLLASPGKVLRTAAGFKKKFSEEIIMLEYEEIGRWISNETCIIYIPPNVKLLWPVKPFNPYKMDGSSPLTSARCVIWGEVNTAEEWEKTFRIKVLRGFLQ